MNRFTYSTLFYLATPLLILRLLWRSLRSPAYLQRWSERFAFYSKAITGKKRCLVFHAVSVGEVHAAVPLINRLLEKSTDIEILVTTSTPTGSKRVNEMLGDKVSHVYLPYDYPGAIQRFIKKFNPVVLVIMETELWPNLIRGCHVNGVKILLANARLSAKSFANYKNVSGITRTMLQQLDKVTVQSIQDSERLQALGLSDEQLAVTGSMKFDIPVNAEQLQQAQHDKKGIGSRSVLIAASTRTADGIIEDELILSAFKTLLQTYPELLLVLVPRHPERFDAVFELAQKQGFKIARRSQEKLPDDNHQIFLGDSMGEMQYFLGLADIAFVGGSLVPTGCQNIIEPAAMGLPVITGPSLFNFHAVSELLVAGNGLHVVQNEMELVEFVLNLLGDKTRRKAMGYAAKGVVQANQGATESNQRIISELLEATR